MENSHTSFLNALKFVLSVFRLFLEQSCSKIIQKLSEALKIISKYIQKFPSINSLQKNFLHFIFDFYTQTFFEKETHLEKHLLDQFYQPTKYYLKNTENSFTISKKLPKKNKKHSHFFATNIKLLFKKTFSLKNITCKTFKQKIKRSPKKVCEIYKISLKKYVVIL